MIPTVEESKAKVRLVMEQLIDIKPEIKNYLDENFGMVPCAIADDLIHEFELQCQDIDYDYETGDVNFL